MIHWKIRPPSIEMFAEAWILQREARGPRGAKSLLRQISKSEGGVFYDSSRLEAVYWHFFQRWRYRKLHPERLRSIDSVKSNTLPLWKKECMEFISLSKSSPLICVKKAFVSEICTSVTCREHFVSGWTGEMAGSRECCEENSQNHHFWSQKLYCDSCFCLYWSILVAC